MDFVLCADAEIINPERAINKKIFLICFGVKGMNLRIVMIEQ